MNKLLLRMEVGSYNVEYLIKTECDCCYIRIEITLSLYINSAVLMQGKADSSGVIYLGKFQVSKAGFFKNFNLNLLLKCAFTPPSKFLIFHILHA